MVRAECINEEAMKSLLLNGLKLDYFRLKVEEFIKPIRPLQCFSCQQFEHLASNCPKKDAIVCLKCSGSHNIKDCDSNSIKCANCDEEHKSNSSECELYKIKLNEVKRNPLRNSSNETTTVKFYSEAIKNNNNVDLVNKLKENFVILIPLT